MRSIGGKLFRVVLFACGGVACGIILAFAAIGVAQTAPAGPSTNVPCEAELAKTQDQMVQLRKGKAQAEYQAAAVEEIALNFQKEVKALQAKVVALEKPPTPVTIGASPKPAPAVGATPPPVTPRP